MKVFVTGADGFVGRNLIASLNASEIKVIKGVRKISQVHDLNQIELGDLPHAPVKISQKLQDVDAIVHLAGFAHQPQNTVESRERCFDINVQGTKRITEIAAAAGIRRVIFLSSVKAHGDFPKQHAVSEAEIDAPTDPYGLSKLQAEQLGFEMAAKHGFQFLALRPPLIYGPGVKANFLKLLRIVHMGIPLPLRNVSNLRSLCYIGNLTHALSTILRFEGLESGKLYVADKETLSTKALLETLAKHLNRKSRLFSLPLWAVESMPQCPFFGDMAEKLFADLFVNTSKLEQQFSWIAPISSDEGLSRTVRWYLDFVESKQVTHAPSGT